MQSTSNSSFYASDVQNIIYGGFTSRFWMLRKHIISMSKDDIKFAPFYSWNCLTIDVGYRKINLVIRDESDMAKILKYLIWEMQTLDGKRGTADKVLAVMNEQSLGEYRKKHGITVI